KRGAPRLLQGKPCRSGVGGLVYGDSFVRPLPLETEFSDEEEPRPLATIHLEDTLPEGVNTLKREPVSENRRSAQGRKEQRVACSVCHEDEQISVAVDIPERGNM